MYTISHEVVISIGCFRFARKTIDVGCARRRRKFSLVWRKNAPGTDRDDTGGVELIRRGEQSIRNGHSVAMDISDDPMYHESNAQVSSRTEQFTEVSPRTGTTADYIVVGIFNRNKSIPKETLVYLDSFPYLWKAIDSAISQIRGWRSFLSLKRVVGFGVYEVQICLSIDIRSWLSLLNFSLSVAIV